MTWQAPLLTYRCGACGTTVTGLMSYIYVLAVDAAHAKVCKGFAPSNHETDGAGNGESRATEDGVTPVEESRVAAASSSGRGE